MVPVWMTFSDLFKVMIIQRQITWKWYNIQLYLQWLTNRKSYMIYRTAPFSTTLNDPYPQFQGHAILWRWISQKRYDIKTSRHWYTNRNSYTTYAGYATVSHRMILSDLAKYSVTRGVVRSLCDSWASCLYLCTFIHLRASLSSSMITAVCAVFREMRWLW